MRRALGVVTRGGAAVARSVGPAGYAVLALLAASYAAVRWAGLAEFVVIGVLCVVLLVLALPFVLLPTRVRARIVLRPTHTVAGETGVARLHVRNRAPVPLLHPAVRLPIGREQVWRRLPTLRPGVETVHELTVPTARRGVIRVGPVRARRTDPLGLLRREATWGRGAELYVRPRMIALDALGSGFLRDQDGAPLDEISMDDLAFHALREYVRGDDLRHVHWRSSARAGQLLVRQYHQTRRNHVTVLLDDAGSAYDAEEDFELRGLGRRLAGGAGLPRPVRADVRVRPRDRERPRRRRGARRVLPGVPGRRRQPGRGGTPCGPARTGHQPPAGHGGTDDPRRGRWRPALLAGRGAHAAVPCRRIVGEPGA